MKAHFLTALFVILTGIYANFSSYELMELVITITLVLVVEMINTAIELTVDMIKAEFHPIARVIKDVSAGAVLLVSINAVVVGYMLFAKKVPFNIDNHLMNIRTSPWHMTFIALILVFGMSILGKILFHKGSPLRGGMPSGHSAIAFAIWTVIVFFTNNSVVIILSLLMAILIARHRVKDAIHTVWEVVVGAILGVLITTLIFQIFR